MAKFLLKDNADYSESRLEEMYNLGENDHPDTTFMDLDTDGRLPQPFHSMG